MTVAPRPLRRPLRRATAAIALALALAATSALAPTGRAQESWAPTGYAQHVRAAWVLMTLLCGPKVPDYYAGPAADDLCPKTYENSLLWLAMALAWTQLPANPGSGETMQTFPKLDDALMERIRELEATAVPGWQVVANPDLARAPDSVRQQLYDTMNRIYDTQVRATLATIRAKDPQWLALDEAPPADGGGSTETGDSGADDGDAEDGDGDGGSTSAEAAPKAAE